MSLSTNWMADSDLRLEQTWFCCQVSFGAKIQITENGEGPILSNVY